MSKVNSLQDLLKVVTKIDATSETTANSLKTFIEDQHAVNNTLLKGLKKLNLARIDLEDSVGKKQKFLADEIMASNLWSTVTAVHEASVTNILIQNKATTSAQSELNILKTQLDNVDGLIYLKVDDKVYKLLKLNSWAYEEVKKDNKSEINKTRSDLHCAIVRTGTVLNNKIEHLLSKGKGLLKTQRSLKRRSRI